MSVNKVILVGNLGNDPEVRNFDNGGMIATVSIATSERWTDRNTGERKEHTEWHRVVFNNRLAEVASQYLRKGSQIYVEGSLRTRKWQDTQTGQERYTTEIRADNMQMLGNRASGDNGGYANPQGGYANSNANPNQQYQNQGNQGGQYPNTAYQQANQFGGQNSSGYAQSQPNQAYPNSGYPQERASQAQGNPMAQNHAFGQPTHIEQNTGMSPTQKPNTPSTNQPVITPSQGLSDDDMPF